jgi:putative membrane protein
MKTLLPLVAVALLAGAPAALAQSDDTDTDAVGPMVTDNKVDTQTFVTTVPNANAFEIQSSKLAEQKSASADVKAFAAQMIKDHTQAGEDFKAALSQGQTTASIKPAAPGLQPKEQQMLDELKGASGKDFDAKYIKMQTDAHKDAVALFSTYAQSGDDPAMKEFAKKTLPVLKMHEKHVKDLAVAHQG